MEFFRSLGIFLLGILKRIYWLIPSLLSDPFDIVERWFGVSYTAPPYTFWLLLFVGFFIAATLTYYDLYRQVEKQKRQSAFHFEYADSGMTTKDGRLFFYVSFFSNIDMIVENLQLELYGTRFQPLDWSPFKLKYIHNKHFVFNISELQKIAPSGEHNGKFIATVDNKEYESQPFTVDTGL